MFVLKEFSSVVKQRNLLISIISRTLFFALSSRVLSIFKVSLVHGAPATYFSLSGIGLPLAGTGKAGMVVATAVAVIRLCTKMLNSGVFVNLHGLAFIIPGWCAALYWAHNTWIIRVGIPLLCIVLFVGHPVGFYAMPYTIYWLLPIFFYYARYEAIFATALGSTLIAHAVGSTIWLYTVHMTSTSWYMLIPLVAVERLLYALGMTALLYAWQWIDRCSKKYALSNDNAVSALLSKLLSFCSCV